MGVAPHKPAAPPPPDDHAPRKTRTPEERRVTLCPTCFLALPAASERCEYCE
ncbi:hypothetical protein [Mycobacterium sp. PS03-16]|uniref:hypothetical protein n=1 Tax=Mycobacterium sp. PS03-16 TaxID=2559611 RepID=UPI00142FFB9B|nr:hypothetical protein [Mycobacterium sp. PS03-16]